MRLSSIAAVAVLLAALSASSAWAEPSQPTGESCIAVGSGYSRVAATVANPQDCCTGRMQCAQFLSTTTVVRPAHDQHT